MRQPVTASSEYDTDYQTGQDNVNMLGMDVHSPVFVTSAVTIILFIVATLLFPSESKQILVGLRGWSINYFDWLIMTGGNIFVLFCIALIFLPVGKIRLGGQEATPDFSLISWFAMLFAAGMGIGLMFWSVAEPVAYYTDWYGTPLNVEPHTPAGASAALGATMFHWGLHPWAIYGVVGLALCFFTYNKGLPLTLRSVFYPLLGERVWGPVGHVIDIVAVLATIFGLATSLGFGAQQASGGLSYLLGIESSLASQVAVIIGVTFVALLSVLRGLDGGVKLLSNINMVLALLLLLFVIVAGSIGAFLGNFADLVGAYATSILPLSNWAGREDQTWFHGWTVFYWAWWVSWAPFVGMFIARVSKGRTVREFMAAVLITPTLLSAVWMAAFGGAALDQAQAGVGELAKGVGEVSLAMYQMLANLPLAELTSAVAVLLVLVFFITSSDSGSLVIDSITSGGKTDGPAHQRVFWAIVQGLIAGVLLFGGGTDALSALQAGAVTTGLPFTVVLILMCVSLYKGLKSELC